MFICSAQQAIDGSELSKDPLPRRLFHAYAGKIAAISDHPTGRPRAEWYKLAVAP